MPPAEKKRKTEKAAVATKKATEEATPTRVINPKKGAEKAAAKAAAAPVAAPVAASSSTAAAKTGEQSPLSALIMLGTYHSVSAGYSLRKHGLALKYSTRCHAGSVVAVAACDRFLVTSGSDERLHIYTVKNHAASLADLGTVCPASQVNAMAFADPRFLVCGCEDGSVAVYKTRSWDCSVVLPVHEKPVRGLAMHPMGTVGVTVSDDRCVCVLDMTRGRVITRHKLSKASPQTVCFSESGDKFLVSTNYEVIVYATATAKKVCRMSLPVDPTSQVQCACFVDDNLFICGTEAGEVYQGAIPALAAGADAAADNDAEVEVKVLELVAPKKAGGDDEDEETIAAPGASKPRVRTLRSVKQTITMATSTGDVSVWTVDAKRSKAGHVTVAHRTSVATGGRITCMAVLEK